MCVSLNVYLYSTWVPRACVSQEGTLDPLKQAVGQPLCGCLELKPSPLQDQQEL